MYQFYFWFLVCTGYVLYFLVTIYGQPDRSHMISIYGNVSINMMADVSVQHVLVINQSRYLIEMPCKTYGKLREVKAKATM